MRALVFFWGCLPVLLFAVAAFFAAAPKRILAKLYAFAILISTTAAAMAADAAAEPSTWGAVEQAVIGLVLLIIGAVTVAVGRVLPGFLTALAAKYIEDATTSRVQRVTGALTEALDAGASPSDAAAFAEKKLPQTLKRSQKDKADLTLEAEVLKKAARLRPPAAR